MISIIVAASENNVIGKDNQLLWKLPNDMKFFKNTTWGMPVVMGRKTFESLDCDYLAGRFNVVITRHPEQITEKLPHLLLADSLTEAVEKAKTTDCKEIFIIGGGQIYAEAMAITDRIYMTRVHTVIEGDTIFPEIDDKIWQKTSQQDFSADDKHAYAYSFEVWDRKVK
ncbi:MAG: dihydrofolate reductase [Chitinophagaceae bacterium]